MTMVTLTPTGRRTEGLTIKIGHCGSGNMATKTCEGETMDFLEKAAIKEIYDMLDSATIELMNTSIPPGSRREQARNLVIAAQEKLDLLIYDSENGGN